jgi:hypothetical protein
VSDECTFCVKRNLRPAPRETFLHLFFNCPESAATLTTLQSKYFQELGLITEEKKIKFWFLGVLEESECDALVFLFCITTMFYIWECKLKKNFQLVSSCELFLKFHFDTMMRISKKLHISFTNSDIAFCRRWRDG